MIENINGKTFSVEFNSISEFNNYICNTPLNEAFRWQELCSSTGSKKFTGTKSFEEAQELLKSGWDDMSKKLVKRIKVNNIDHDAAMVRKTILSQVGYQAIVPNYLNGCPNNMVNTKLVAKKQPVINIYKNISYNCSWTTEQIIEESIKSLEIVKNIESQGIRCNLYTVWSAKTCGRTIIIKVKIKSSNEKVNISKLSFPLVNPSMIRRLHFRFLEVYPNATKGFCGGYGCPCGDGELKKTLEKNDYLLPKEISKEVKCMNDLEASYTCNDVKN